MNPIQLRSPLSINWRQLPANQYNWQQ